MNSANEAKMGNVETLSLKATKISDSCFNELVELRGLAKLNLSGTLITDKGLPTLDVLKRLKSLDLTKTKCTEMGRQALRAKLPACEIILDP